MLLLVLYGTAVTEHDPGAPLLRGFVLLVLVGAWLWLPRLTPREASRRGRAWSPPWGSSRCPWPPPSTPSGPGGTTATGSCSATGRAVTFDWTHSLRAARLAARRHHPAEHQVRPAALLEGRDARRLRRLPLAAHRRAAAPATSCPGLPATRPPEGRRWNYFEYNPRWDAQFRVTVRSLSSQLVVGAGITYEVDGRRRRAQRRTTAPRSAPTTIRSSAATPTPCGPTRPTRRRRRCAARPGDSPSSLLQYTHGGAARSAGESALDPGRLSPRRVRPRRRCRCRCATAPSGSDRGRATTPRCATRRYARAYRLALELTARRGHHLRRGEGGGELPPAQLPLQRAAAQRATCRSTAFLFEDRIGYCQQFSGAMALMLRMAGIPARVAAGFSPGSYNRDSGEYRVRDLDAHSWVEVYFNGIGWVPFDPTPTAAPAESQSSGLGATSAAARRRGRGALPRRGRATSERAGGGDAGAARRRGGRAGLVGARARSLLAAGAAAAAVRARSRAPPERSERRHGGGAARRAAPRARAARLLASGGHHPARRSSAASAAASGPASARYAAALRAHRFDPRAPDGARAWPSAVRCGASSPRAAGCAAGCAACSRFRLAVRARFS